MSSSLSGFNSGSVSYSDLTADIDRLRQTVSQLEIAVRTGIVSKGPLEYILKNLIQAGNMDPESRELVIVENLYMELYGQHLPTGLKYAGVKNLKSKPAL